MKRKERGPNKVKINFSFNVNLEFTLRKILMKMNPTYIVPIVAVILYFLGVRFI